ncbi:hypothetical protein [Clostridium beijerinckii]|jgi:hypothetical protein|uniref:Uncharacterized protein n=2 Tax=Clostridium beijerinckii TaxID=1520 RepID=A0AAE2RRN9_CLOBE|nr:hypothetical protein [Clostridium beijerinckii]ABR36358.1 conserved hypothetical protein [Clostridium beijerinckii NCIMB 8052]AIU00942.1 hypothetical protein Cbs_4248 [Clostridium beijerinckii ATCC 35702]MBC2455869.1 hypothetical protein [Clostridium beijerinckii]MBC2474674.1 hypothetical protein [Clostridium beijerinckii]MBF7808996.1 hypothetical protein [Clostridium beijerinckii]
MPLILLIIGFSLIVYNYRSIKRENNINKENDTLNISFQSVLQDSKEELNDYKMEIGLLRRDIAESLTELQEEIIKIKIDLKELKNVEEGSENKEDLEIEEFLDKYDIDDSINYREDTEDHKKSKRLYIVDDSIMELDEEYTESLTDTDIDEEIGVISEINFSESADSNKTQSIKRLLNAGLTEDEICRELSVSKGEVLLVKGLFKK